MIYLYIGLGGAFGSILRYLAGGWVQALARSATFPYGTLAVNLAGCLLIGFLSRLVESRGFISPETRLLLITGFLGGFTTFSTFSNESVDLLRNADFTRGLLNLGLHLALGLAAVWLGRALAYWIWR